MSKQTLARVWLILLTVVALTAVVVRWPWRDYTLKTVLFTGLAHEGLAAIAFEEQGYPGVFSILAPVNLVLRVIVSAVSVYLMLRVTVWAVTTLRRPRRRVRGSTAGPAIPVNAPRKDK